MAKKKSKPRMVRLDEIAFDPAINPRISRLRQAVVDEYAAAMQAGDEFPPVDLFNLDQAYALAGGAHRCEAAKKAGRNSILAVIHEGSVLDAKMFALNDNRRHGCRDSADDNEARVVAVLSEPAWAAWSTNAIADRLGLSWNFVDRIRQAVQPDKPTKVTCSDGRGGVKTMDTTALGGRKSLPSKGSDEKKQPKPKPKAEATPLPVPKSVRDSAAASEHLVQIDLELAAMENTLRQAATWNPWLRLEVLSGTIAKLRQTVQDSVYHETCPKCKGVGCERDPKLCRGSGWLPAWRWDEARLAGEIVSESPTNP